MNRTPSQQECVKTHIRTMSQEKAMQQQAQQYHQQKQFQQQQHWQQQYQYQQHQQPQNHKQPQHHQHQQRTSMPPVHHQSPQFPYNNPPQHEIYQGAFPPQQSAYTHQNYAYQPTGLQFQSQQGFQMQMQRESQQQPDWRHNPNGYEGFMKGLQAASGLGQGNRAGSPLKYEMGGAGSQTLPMMNNERF